MVLRKNQKLRYNNHPIISEKKLICLLNTFTSKGIPERKLNRHDFKWVYHLQDLRILERCLRLSCDFSNEKAVSIFYEYIKFMKTQGFDVNKELLCQDKTPISSAVLYQSPILLSALLQAGAKVNKIRRFNKRMAIHQLSLTPFSNFPKSQELVNQCIQVLIEYGADPNSSTRAIVSRVDQKLTPLWWAAHFGEEKTVDALVKVGADVNQETNHLSGDSTPLQAAAYSGYLKTVKKLIELGANPHQKNSKQETASDLARKNRHVETADYLDKILSKK